MIKTNEKRLLCNLKIKINKGHEHENAYDIILPPVEIFDNKQHIANLKEPINLCIEI